MRTAARLALEALDRLRPLGSLTSKPGHPEEQRDEGSRSTVVPLDSNV